MTSGIVPTMMYRTPATSDERLAIFGVRVAMRRPTSSAAITEPQIGIAHSSAIAHADAPVAGRIDTGPTAPNVSANRPDCGSAMTTPDSRMKRPTVITTLWITSLVASASSPPNRVYSIVKPAAQAMATLGEIVLLVVRI